jgi:phage-related tail fiber protein
VKFLNNLDLVQNEIQNARVQNLGTAPSSPVAGQVYFDTSLGYLRLYDGSGWVRIDDSWVSSVSGTAPIQSTGGATPTISIDAASTSSAGSMSASDKTKLDDATSDATASKLVIRDANSQAKFGSPTDSAHVATKAYVDSFVQGLDTKASVRVATTADITLDNTTTSIDGVTLSNGDRVLVKDQSTGSENGLYVVNTSGSWSRSTDADGNSEVTPGMFVFVEEGTSNGDNGYVLTTNGTITLGTTALTFQQFSGAGQITAGDGLTKSGNTINAVGTSNRITVDADSIDIAATYVGQSSITTLGTISTGTWQGTDVGVAHGGTGASDAAGAKTNLGFMTRYSSTIGDGSSTSIAVTHSLGTKDVIVQVHDSSTDEVVYPDVTKTSTSQVTIDFATAPSTNAYRVVVIG